MSIAMVSSRWAVASRVLAGTAGAYALASLATTAVSLVLVRAGMVKAEAVITATLASFAIFTTVSVMVFHATSATRAWVWLAGTALPLGVIMYLLTIGR